MSKPYNPVEREVAEMSSSPRNRHPKTSRRSFRRGRMWLILMFFALRGADALMYYGNPARDKRQLVASLVVCALWTTAALAGVWFRSNWCRGALIFLLLCSITSSTFFSPGVLEIPLNYPVLALIAVAALAHGGAIWGLVGLDDITRIRSRWYM